MLTVEQLNFLLSATRAKWKVVCFVNRSFCKCVCACGLERKVRYNNLRDGNSKSCLQCASKRPRHRARVYPFPEGSTSRLRLRVRNAINRCTDKDHERYGDWGGRGIRVCSPWLERPELFVTYLMTLSGWDDNDLVLDRIDNDGHYEPGNLRFVTRYESMRNRREYRRRA